MNEEDELFIKGYENLIKKGYCNCNEMNCLDNNSPQRILNIVKYLQQELQRKDNIINELKTYLEYEIEEWKDVENEWGKIRTSEDKDILDKINELEGDNK